MGCNKVEIYNVEQCWINVFYFNVNINEVRQRRNNIFAFKVEFHNVGQQRNRQEKPKSLILQNVLSAISIHEVGSTELTQNDKIFQNPLTKSLVITDFFD